MGSEYISRSSLEEHVVEADTISSCLCYNYIQLIMPYCPECGTEVEEGIKFLLRMRGKYATRR